MSNLTDKFQHFVGQTVKHPNRVTCDECPTTTALSNLAFEEGLMVTFNIAGEPSNDMDVMLDIDMLVVDLIVNDDERLEIHDIHVG